MFKISHKTKKILKKIGLAILAVAIIGGSAAIVNGLVERSKEDYKETRLSWDIGGIAADGKFDTECEDAIYTKNAIECSGVELYADFDSSIDYEVHFYDENGEWLSKMANTGLQMKVDEMPENATAIRIVIRPTNDEDGEISYLEKFEYANQLTVKIRSIEDTPKAE